MKKLKSMLRFSLLLLIFTFGDYNTVVGAPDNRGKVFILSFMENEEAQGTTFSCIPVYVYVSTAVNETVNVTVSTPRFQPNVVNTFSITKGAIKRLDLNCNLRNFNTSKSFKGIWVRASHEVVVYGINRQTRCTDGFLALPTDVLGTTHATVSFHKEHNANYFSNLLVIGIHNHTFVNITLPDNENVEVVYKQKTFRRKMVLTDYINRFETLQLQSIGDLSGSIVKSSLPVAVLSGNKKTDIHFNNDNGGIDHLTEQIPPTDTWGKKFITVPIPKRHEKQVFKILASDDDTDVTVHACGNDIKFNLSPSEYKMYLVENSCPTSIVANKGILVAQFVPSRFKAVTTFTDPAMFIVPPVEQYAADYILSLPEATDKHMFENYFLVIIKESEKGGLKLDNKLVTHWDNFQHVPGTDYTAGYLFAGKDTKVHSLEHISQISVFGAIAYGAAFVESYAFPIGLRLAPINKVCYKTPMVAADGLDNDCDGYIDEEICYSDTHDDDNDGQINEDCAKLNPGVTHPSTTSPKPTTKTKTNGAIKTTEQSTKEPTKTSIITTEQSTTTEPTKTSIITTEQSTTALTTKFTVVATGTRNYGIGDEEFVELPPWVKNIEKAILVFCSIIVTGALLHLCVCCRKVGFLTRRNDEEDDDWKQWSLKKRPLPRNRVI